MHPRLRFGKPFRYINCRVEYGCQWLHYVCTDVAVYGLVANWHRLSPSVRAAVVALVRGG